MNHSTKRTVHLKDHVHVRNLQTKLQQIAKNGVLPGQIENAEGESTTLEARLSFGGITDKIDSED